MDSRRGFFFHDRNGEVNFFFEQQAFQFRLVAFAQADFQAGKFFPQILQQFRQMIAQHNCCGADADVPRLPALHLLLNEAPPVMGRRRRTRRGTDVPQQPGPEDVIGYLREHGITLTYDPDAGTLQAGAAEAAKTTIRKAS